MVALVVWLVGGAVAAAALGGSKKKKPLVVSLGEASFDKPGLGPSFTDEWTFVGDFSPKPGGYDSVNSRWCMPAFAGGGCANVPIELGYPSSWVSAEGLQMELFQTGWRPTMDLLVTARAAISKNKGAKIAGNPSAYTPAPCKTYRFIGTPPVSGGKVPMVNQDDGPALVNYGQECAFALSQLPPQIRVIKDEGVWRVILTIEPGKGSWALFEVVANWRKA